MNKNKLKTLSLAVSFSSALFSILCFSYHLDVSISALPLALIFTATVYLAGFSQLFCKKDLAFISVFRELLQYHPYVLLIAFVLRRAGANGTFQALDLIEVLLWCVTSVLDIYILHYLNPKKIGLIDSEWKKYIETHNLASKKGVKRIALELLSWIDALVQAVFMVLLLNIFIVQLYEIPSESMVPEFLIRDRVVVFKTTSGPKFPLSNVGLPYMKKYKRGDIVVFRNPHYSDDRQSEVRTFLSQIVYMCSLTTVNLNVDSDGNPKADPLVKRVTGVPGEQLMMQDGILYSRTKASDEWKAVEMDSKYAEYNLNQVKPSVKNGIKDFIVSQADYDTMLECEEERKAFNVKVASKECLNLSRQFDRAFNMYVGAKSDGKLSEYFNQNNLFEYNLFAGHGSVAQKLLSSTDGKLWFNKFMTDWINQGTVDFKGNLYEEACFKLDLMIKEVAGKLIVRDAQLIAGGVDSSRFNSDGQVMDLLQQAEKLHAYMFLMDRRNMPAFPADDKDGNPQYIPSNCYFMMGDNRFNSLDMRHSYNDWLTPLTKYDQYSVTYLTNMQPQYVNRSRILGTTCYRFWPPARRGVPGHTGK